MYCVIMLYVFCGFSNCESMWLCLGHLARLKRSRDTGHNAISHAIVRKIQTHSTRQTRNKISSRFMPPPVTLATSLRYYVIVSEIRMF